MDDQAHIVIPSNLEECYKELKKIFGETSLKEFIDDPEEKALINQHHYLGRHLRNRWGLWTGSPLKSYFENIGIFHADDMSGIIIASFWRHLNNKPILLDEQIKFYQDFWEKNKDKTK